MNLSTSTARSAIRSVATRGLEMRDRVREHFRLTAKPVIMRDAHGFRFIRYPWDLIDHRTLVRSGYNADDFAVLDLLVRQGGLVVDVGANIGSYACHFSRLVGEAGKVHAFEPVLETYWQLRENLELNRCRNVTPYRVALGEYDGACRMHTFDKGHSAFSGRAAGPMSSLRPNGVEEVPIRRLDSICDEQRIYRVDLLKVDVEGFEVEVLQGASGLLRRGAIGVVMLEVSAAQLKRSAHRPSEAFALLRDSGYFTYEYDLRRGRSAGRFPTRPRSSQTIFPASACLGCCMKRNWSRCADFEKASYACRPAQASGTARQSASFREGTTVFSGRSPG